MSASALNAPEFDDEATAYAVVEACLWPDGPVCPRCGATDRISALKGKSTRIGLRFCGRCRRQFTVKIGTIFEDSHLPMTKWLQAIYLMTSSKKGISSHQLHRILGVTLKTAWFLSHRIREAIRDGTLAPLGGGQGFGNAVEADETLYLTATSGRSRGMRPGQPERDVRPRVC